MENINMKRMVHILQTLLFSILLFAALCHVSDILMRKESSEKYTPFLEDKTEFDVLFMGNSHMVNGVFPMELWRDYGIASYNIAGYGNTLPTSYWAMKLAFEYHVPKLMVIDISNVSREEKLTGSSGDLHKTLDCYPLSLMKIQAVNDLCDDPTLVDDDNNFYKDMKWEYYLPLGKYHSRWNDLHESDFVLDANRQKGAEAIIGVAQPREYTIFEDDYATEELGWGFVYLRKMIEECQARGVDVLLTHVPFPSKQYQQRDANAIRYIAEEYGVDFVDMVYMDQVVDYDTDLFDPSAHLNPSGAKKVTDFLGRYIMDHYAIEDRRDDEKYAQWHLDSEKYLNDKISMIRRQESPDKVLMLLHDSGFGLRLFIPGDSALYEDEKLMLLMHNIAREHVFEEDEFVKYSYTMFPLSVFDDASWYGEDYFLSLDRSSGRIDEYIGEDARNMHAQVFPDSEGDTAEFMLTHIQTNETLYRGKLNL